LAGGSAEERHLLTVEVPRKHLLDRIVEDFLRLLDKEIMM
jgi:hypothetical protein